jgi:hypothetical protein
MIVFFYFVFYCFAFCSYQAAAMGEFAKEKVFKEPKRAPITAGEEEQAVERMLQFEMKLSNQDRQKKPKKRKAPSEGGLTLFCFFYLLGLLSWFQSICKVHLHL